MGDMTNPNLTEIIFLLDRSGSMMSIAADMTGGFKKFIEDQKAVPGECVVTLYRFNTRFDKVYEELPLANVPDLELDPSGGTALFDALANSIIDVGRRLAAKPEEQRPGRVVFAVITDGEENSSSEFRGKIHVLRNMITEQTDRYNWQFAFLGANIDSFAAGGQLGVAAASTMDYMPTSIGTRSMYDSLSRGVSTYRNASSDAKLSVVADKTDDTDETAAGTGSK